MGQATLNGRPFRIDPISIQWAYSIKTSVTETVGGKVVQIFGTDIDDMMVSGTFGIGGWQEQAAFLKQATAWAQGQADNPTGPPMRFLYPPKGWDFLVYLRAYSQTGGPSVEISNQTPGPPWMLTLFIVEDNSGLRAVKDAAMQAYIERLATGIGWKQTEFNGPGDVQTVKNTLGGQDVQTFVTNALYPPAAANP